MFVSSIEEDDTAWMNIGGRDVKLSLVSVQGRIGKDGVDTRSTERYATGDITVVGRYIVTKVCAPEDENCESTSYSVTFVVTKGRQSQTVKAVGSCGC